jgi:hypothetical protein
MRQPHGSMPRASKNKEVFAQLWPGEIVGSRRTDQFCENLRFKLTNVDSKMNALKAKIDGKAQGTAPDVAIAAVDEAERAVLEAWLARRDADFA